MSIENMRNLLVSSSEWIISFETCTLRVLISKNKEIYLPPYLVFIIKTKRRKIQQSVTKFT